MKNLYSIASYLPEILILSMYKKVKSQVYWKRPDDELCAVEIVRDG